MAPSMFAIGVGVRAVALAAIAFAVIQLLATQRLYATAIVAASIGALLLIELARYVSKGDRMLERFVEGLAAGDFERPLSSGRGASGFRNLTHAIERAASSLGAARAQRQRQIDYLQTIVDNISVAVLVVDEEGAIALANRAARQLVRHPISRLEQLAFGGSHAALGLGASAVDQGVHASEPSAMPLQSLVPGQRAIVRLANGQRVLASVARFTAAGVSSRLFALQNIESELDAVELKAWQDLVRILAHEMMNSLTPIASLAESVRPLLDEAAAAAHKDTRQLSGERQPTRAADIASAIDAIARRSAGLMRFVERYRQIADLPRPALRAVRLDDLAGRVQQLMSAMVESRGIAYTSSVEPANLSALADPDMLEQALINLLRNAVDALGERANGHIEVRCRLQDSTVAISVADNGPGVDASTRDRIFVPFFTTKPGGSGIGLSLARQIAHAHGGRLEVAHNTPSGAVFTLILPTRSEGYT
jgi:two-component system, NtrC family, nitrogen regulation sensor histidine kinase NtrY